MKYNLVLTLASTLALLLLLVGCDAYEDGGGEKGEPVQTELLRVEVIPSPVAAGDTALFRAVIEDSLDERFSFRWFKGGGRFAGVDEQFSATTTDTNSVLWIAPDGVGTYNFAVSIDNGSRDSLGTGGSFDVTVVERN